VASKCGRNERLVCLEAGCGGSVDDDEVQEWLRRAGKDAAVFKLYKAAARCAEVASRPDLCFCPGVDCGEVVSRRIDPATGKPAASAPVTCSACALRFCGVCKQPWAAVTTRGVSVQHMCVLDEGVRDCGLDLKQCPKCGVWVERGDDTGRGCAQMRCNTCHHMFCWYCLADLDGDMLLLHFNKGRCRNSGGDLGHTNGQLICYRVQVVVSMFFMVLLGIVCLAPAILMTVIYCIMVCFAECFGCSDAIALRPPPPADMRRPYEPPQATPAGSEAKATAPRAGVEKVAAPSTTDSIEVVVAT